MIIFILFIYDISFLKYMIEYSQKIFIFLILNFHESQFHKH